MTPARAIELLRAAIAAADRAPVENYVINGKPGFHETEFVIDLVSPSMRVYVFERGTIRNECFFSDAGDAARYFLGLLFAYPTFRRAFVSLGGEFTADASAADYIHAFRHVANHVGIPDAAYHLPDEGDDVQTDATLVVWQDSDRWNVRSADDADLDEARFATCREALTFAHWKLTGAIRLE